MAGRLAKAGAGRGCGRRAGALSQPGSPGPAAMPLLYKICPKALWAEAEEAGGFSGSPVDHADGFIHLSTAAQAPETAARHFAGQADLLLVAVDEAALGEALRHEPSRGGDLFPHLYGPLPLSAVAWVRDLPLSDDGRHAFPAEVAA